MRRCASSRYGLAASILLGWFGAAGGAVAQDVPAAPDDGAPQVTQRPPPAGSDGEANGDNAAGNDQEGDFLAFLEYLGSWEDSDAEWKQFHPEEGLVGVGNAPGSATQDPVREEVDWKQDDGRS
jgi:hypothetical protein